MLKSYIVPILVKTIKLTYVNQSKNKIKFKFFLSGFHIKVQVYNVLQ